MSAQIIPFRYAEARDLRTVIIDGAPWFILNDLCAVLEHTNSRMVAARLPEDDVSLTYVTDSIGREQPTTIVSEAGLYRVVLRSDKPQAEPFIQWVTHTVLPEIRKTGSYGIAKALPQSYPEALRALAAEAEAHELAKLRIVELEPAAKAWRNIASSAGDFEVGDAAKMLSRDPSINIGPRKMFEWLELHGWIFRRHDGRYRAYQGKIDAGLLAERANRPYLNEQTGEYQSPAPQVRVTPKGMDRLYAALGGQEAVA